MAKEDKKDKKGKKDKSGKSDKNSNSIIKSMTDDTGRIFHLLSGVRNSFPALHAFPVINGEKQDSGSMKLMLNKEDKRDMAILEEMKAIAAGLTDSKNKGNALSDEKYCFKDGAKLDNPQPGYWLVSCNCPSNTLPTVIDASGKGVVRDASACKIYSGARVNVKLSFWFQDNNYGKRVNAQLVSVQFHSDDEPLDASHVTEEDSMQGFHMVDENADSDAVDGLV